MIKHGRLFELSQAEQQLTNELQIIITNEIQAANGVIPFSRYMELALYYPTLGYYNNPRFKFASHGDFITAPLISNVFAQLLYRQIQQIFSFAVMPQIVEIGAGNGQLAADLLLFAADGLSNYFILELSADLVLQQRETIYQQAPQYAHKVQWLNALPTAFNGVIIANEVLDAQPCDLIKINANKIEGLGVAFNESAGFYYHDYNLDMSTLNLAKELDLPADDYITEIHVINRAFVASLATNLAHGAILLIDYGYAQKEYYHSQRNRGTLRGFYRHHLLENVLCYPGLIDITTSVNWSAVLNSALNHDLDFIGYTNQANFLLSLGLSDILEQAHVKLSTSDYLRLTNQVNQLIAPQQMGELFKVMAFSRGIIEDNWLGFAGLDLSYTL